MNSKNGVYFASRSGVKILDQDHQRYDATLSEWTTRKNINYNQEFPCFLGQARKKMDNPSKTRTGGSTKYFLREVAACLAVASAEVRPHCLHDRGAGSALL